MNSRINFDEIRRQADIVQVINTYVPLTRHGKGFVGVCPFHNDSNPSLQVSPDKQIYKCFSCGASGNVFTFVQNYEKVPFIDAVRKVAEICGIKVEGLEKRTEARTSSLETKLYQLFKDLTNYYSYQLKVPSGSEALGYLTRRNLGNEEINAFNIGFSPADGRSVVKFLQSKGYGLDEIITSGVGVEIAPNEVVDRMRGRVVFAIADSYGRVIGYSGRRLKEEDSDSKYLNTPETMLFHKSSVLYNYHQALENSKREGTVYIVEGFMDAIALNKAGIKAVVATMGTAFTDEHLKLLATLHCELRLLFDSDNPGLKATYLALERLDKTKLKVMVVKPLSGGKDIDETLQESGKESVLSAINNLYTPLDFRLFYLGKHYNLKNHEDAKSYIKKVATYLAATKADDFDREHYVDLLSEQTGYSKELIRRSIRNIRDQDEIERLPKETRVRSGSQQKKLNRFEQAERQIIQLLLEDGVNIVKFNNQGVPLYSKMCRDIAALIVDKFYENSKVEYADLFTDISPDMAKTITEIFNEKYPPTKIENLMKIVNEDLNEKIEEENLEQQILEVSDINAQAKLAEEIIARRRAKNKRINKGEVK